MLTVQGQGSSPPPLLPGRPVSVRVMVRSTATGTPDRRAASAAAESQIAAPSGAAPGATACTTSRAAARNGMARRAGVKITGGGSPPAMYEESPSLPRVRKS